MKASLRFILLFILLLLLGGTAVGLSDLGKVCLFSAISGVITQDGKPVANARLVRTANRRGKKDETTTDAEGYFSLPAMYERTITKYLPQEFSVGQLITVEYLNKNYELWSGVKGKPEENAESRGKPLVVQCDLNNEKKLKEVNSSPIISKCTWEAKPDPPFDMSKVFEPDS